MGRSEQEGGGESTGRAYLGRITSHRHFRRIAMSHQADETFFITKREWSRRKDRILSHYLKPYLAKVAKLGKPILIVDGFAGPGMFEDGSEGSPFIICRRAAEQLDRGSNVEVLCIEKSNPLFHRLKSNLSSVKFATAEHGSFSDFAKTIQERAEHATTFLYLDPYAIRGLQWSAIEVIARRIQSHSSSVELLLNLNVPAFARSARAALARSVPAVDPAAEDTDEIDVGFPATPSKESLSLIAGGDWWCAIVMKEMEFRTEVHELMRGFASNMRRIFREVGFVPIKAKESHIIPKYFLAYGTRNIEGLILMNDEMVRASRDGEFQTDLITELELDELLVSSSENAVRRDGLIHTALRSVFARFTKSEVLRRIEHLKAMGELARVGSAGKGKSNELLRRAQSRLL